MFYTFYRYKNVLEDLYVYDLIRNLKITILDYLSTTH